MTTDLDPRIRTYTRAVSHSQRRIEPVEARRSGLHRRASTRGLPMAVAAVLAVVTVIGGAAWLARFAPDAADVAETSLGSGIADGGVRSDPTNGTPFPDLGSAVPGDDESGPLPLGEVSSLPDSVRLDFLFELCWTPTCFRDAHFMDPSGSGLGSGVFEPDTPFHVREGFPVTGDAPLGEGYDVVLYVTPMDHPGELGGAVVGTPVRYTADYVVRGETDACGPVYETQTGTVTCEWFVHEFPDGLPAGRHAMWAVWEAPCRAWIEYGFVAECADPGRVLSLFTSGFDAPFEVGATSYDEIDRGGSPSVEGLLGDRSSFVQLPVVDASGAAPTGGTPVPDLLTATQDGGRTLPLGEVKTLPGTVRLDFLFELCLPEVCFRDAHFIDPAGTGLGSGSFAADEPFHVRHGFPVFKDEPLGQGFDIVVYVTPMDHPGEFGGAATGPTIRHDADYIVRGEAAGCGPTYRSEEDEVTCEWFVHEFPDGLPAGRHALWAMWEAPCWAWIEYGFVEGCADPGEVLSLFASGFDAPFGDAPSYPERDQRPRKSVGAAAG